MRTIPATLLAGQKTLTGIPALTLTFGATFPYDATEYVLEYKYREPGRLTILLDNSDGTFNTLPEKVKQGEQVQLNRGMKIDGAKYTAPLPRMWVEEIVYDYGSSQSTLHIECIDWWEKLQQYRALGERAFSNTPIQTMLTQMLATVGLTLAAGEMTDLSIDFTLTTGQALTSAVSHLTAKIPEYLYPGLAGEIKWKQIPGGESSVYTYGWNSQHPVIEHEGGETAWRYNEVQVSAKGGTYIGTASDAAQVADVGQRRLTIPDAELNSNDECTQRAEAELDFFEAGAIETTIVARPTHGLEQFDVVTIDNPAWGGNDLTGRVIRYVERYAPGHWKQTISTGLAAQKPAGRATASSPSLRPTEEYAIEESITAPIKNHLHVAISGDGGLIPSTKVSYAFEDTTERDNFFTTYPNLLAEDTIIIIKKNGTLALQRYTGSEWENKSIQCLQNIRAVTSTYTITASDEVLLCDGTFTITLPSAAEQPGKPYTIIVTTPGSKVTAATYGSEEINDSPTQILYYADGMQVTSTGTNWRIK